jgi:putative chitinase
MSLWQSFASFFRAPPVSSEPAPLPMPVVAVGEGDAPNWPVILRAVGFLAPDAWAAHLAGPAARRGIHRGRRAAAFAATIAHESNGGRLLVENLNYSPAGLVKTWRSRFTQDQAERMGRTATKPADQAAIANRVYASRMGNGGPQSGDGFRYRGRGLIQLTGRDAYARAGEALNLPLVSSPEMAADMKHAAEIAAWTWSVWKGCNDPADRGDVEAWRRAINGGLIGLDDVRERYQAALKA